jgi:uncharacterized protein (TIGR02271 family)
MIEREDIDRIEGSTAYDAMGEKVGRVGQLYLDDDTGRPSWVTVSTGLFGTSETFVPLDGASFDGEELRLAYSKDTIKDAPRLEADEHLGPSDEAELDRYYGLAGVTGTTPPAQAGVVDRELDQGVDRDETAMTLSEEHLDVRTVEQEAGRVRLRRYVTTETETVNVPVRKEKLVVERVPAGDTATEPITDPDGTSEVLEEITLREERVVVDTETVAVEQVRVGTQQVTEEQEVTGEVRRERADVDVDGASSPA